MGPKAESLPNQPQTSPCVPSASGIHPCRRNQPATVPENNGSIGGGIPSHIRPTSCLCDEQSETESIYATPAWPANEITKPSIPHRLSRRLELPSQLLWRAAQLDQLDHLLPQLGWIRRTRSRHHGLLSPNRSGVHGNGSSPNTSFRRVLSWASVPVSSSRIIRL